MPARVRLKIMEGPLAGKVFVFDDHDVCLFGRDPKCHLNLPDDRFISRHHLMLEVNPPLVSVRDLNSLNGMIINGQRFGGRTAGGGPADAAKDEPVVLLHGDRIQVGQTVMQVEVEETTGPIVALRCAMCGRDVSGPEPGLDGADYLCEPCSKQVAADPERLLKTMVQRGLTVRGQGSGRSMADYKVGERLGSGGMGSVYFAESRADGAKVALKVLHSSLASSKQNRESFLREMLVLSSLKHPAIVEYRDYGTAGNTFFFVVQYCNGGTLAELNRNEGGRVPWAQAMPYFRQVLEGLAYAHGRDVVHRDLKPDNVFLHHEGGTTTARIGDFGFAKIFTLAGMTNLTQTGEYAGSFLFMSRDQLTNFKFATPACDIWAAAATFYYVLTGQFTREMALGKDPVDVIMEDKIRPIEHWGVEMPPRLAAVINRGLASEVEKRWGSAEIFLKALNQAV